jgi:pilus assembly protein Flp/PilA
LKKWLDKAQGFISDNSGAALIEYTALIGVLVIAVMATILLIGGWINGTWTSLLGLLP